MKCQNCSKELFRAEVVEFRIARSSPLIWEHVNQCGRFELNVETRLDLSQMAPGNTTVGRTPNWARMSESITGFVELEVGTNCAWILFLDYGPLGNKPILCRPDADRDRLQRGVAEWVKSKSK